MKTSIRSVVFSILIPALLVSGCASTTKVRSTDPEAKIYIDGEYKGKGSVDHTDSKIVGSTTNVRLQKDGCQPESYLFARNEEVDAGACVGGVLLLFPFLWVEKYKPEHTYEYTCKKEVTVNR